MKQPFNAWIERVLSALERFAEDLGRFERVAIRLGIALIGLLTVLGVLARVVIEKLPWQ
jgi:hypothetical protein